MENASKALIIAGAILLSILIIALGIYVFNMAKTASNTNSLDELEVSQFNQMFKEYEGKKMGSMVASLLDKVITNATNNKESDERLIGIVYIKGQGSQISVSDIGGNQQGTDGIKSSDPDDNTEKTEFDDACNLAGITFTEQTDLYIESNVNHINTTAIGRLRSKLADRHYYQVTCHQNSVTGLIDFIIINYDAK